MERLYLKPALCKAIDEYCKMNNIEDINAFANRCATQGFNIVKYGLSPKDNVERETKGIKDIKNEKSRKKKEPSPIEEGKSVEPKPTTRKPETKEEDIKPIEEEKKVVKRKIVVIKKTSKDD